jgi:hypothetical protein
VSSGCPCLYSKLCAWLRDRGLLVDTLHVSVEEQLAMFLKIVGQYRTHSSVAIAMWRSEWTVSTYFNVVLRAIVKLAPELIYVRSTSTHSNITKSPNRFDPYFEVTLYSVSNIFFICNFRYKFFDTCLSLCIGLYRGTRWHSHQGMCAC